MELHQEPAVRTLVRVSVLRAHCAVRDAADAIQLLQHVRPMGRRVRPLLPRR